MTTKTTSPLKPQQCLHTHARTHTHTHNSRVCRERNELQLTTGVEGKNRSVLPSKECACRGGRGGGGSIRFAEAGAMRVQEGGGGVVG